MSSAIEAPMQGTVLSVLPVGSLVRAGGAVVVLESMKMQHDVTVDRPSRVVDVRVSIGDTVMAGASLVLVESAEVASDTATNLADDTGPRVDLSEVVARHQSGLDDARGDATSRRHSAGRRTARENVADLVDADSFVEYGPLVIAAQRRRRGVD
ncbi:MAG: hypothetical protein RL413_767, partial [Actinomycetota bacterium]